ncbi:MAG: hypothetical protein K2Q18_06865 [Bdellovibrionales bacterium]|nr:hypothetical protein [Bdellovibrionales bacterium]
MKLFCLFIAITFSNISFGSMCDNSKGSLETSFGIYQFTSIGLCNDAYKLATECHKENVMRSKKADIEKTKYVAVDCLQKILGFFEKNNITRIGDTEFVN